MKMMIKKLRMQNFKGCEDSTMEFGHRTNIYGRNATGKTTIHDAVMWVLFNKMADGTKPDQIRPHNANGGNIDFVDIIVELTLEIDDLEYTIKKTQKQNWVQHHGSLEKVFEGNENCWEVNGIPKSQMEYRKWLNQMIDEEVFMFTASATAFMKLAMKKRREVLFNLVTDISNADVIAANNELDPVASIIATCTPEEAMKLATKNIRAYNKQLTEIPARIDELSKQIVRIDVSDMELQKNELQRQIDEAEKQREDALYAVEQASKTTDELMSLQFEKSEIEKRAIDNLNKEKSTVNEEINQIEQDFMQCVSRQNVIDFEIKSMSDRVSSIKEDKETLAKEFLEIKAEELAEDSKVCPTCGQAFPMERQEEIKKDFEKNKTDRLSDINIRGADMKKSIEELEATILEYNKELSEVKNKKIELNRRKTELMEILSKMPERPDLSDNQEYERICLEISKKEEALKTVNSSTAYRNQLKAQIDMWKQELETVNENLLKADSSMIENRIEILKKEQRTIAQKVADAEKNKYLLECFNRAKISMLTDAINSHFKIVKWKLFEKQVNGGYKEVCVPQINGNDYGKGLNTGHMIAAELDITSTLQKINDVSVPIFLDNAESINPENIPDIDSQLITLNVSTDDVLKVEV